MTKATRAHLANVKAARKAGNRKLARMFMRFARAAQMRGAK